MGNSSAQCRRELITKQDLRASTSIHFLAIITCLLFIITVFNIFFLTSHGRGEGSRAVCASRLAEESLECVMLELRARGVENFDASKMDRFVFDEEGRRFWREIRISPGEGMEVRNRVTVVVGWRTFWGREHVRVRGMFLEPRIGQVVDRVGR